MALAGAKIPEQFNGGPTTPLQGISLAPLFRPDGKRVSRERPIFFEHEGNRAVRDEKWKLVAKGVEGQWELYDLAADRTEMHNLAAEDPQRVKVMSAAWQQWAETSQVLLLRPWDEPGGAAE